MIRVLFPRTLMGAVLLALVFVGAACKGGAQKEQAAAAKKVTIEVWGVFETQADWAEVIAKYRAQRPHINVVYRKFRLEEFERELLNALAEDKGPDIITLPVSSLRGYQSKLAPQPEQYKIAFIFTKGGVGIGGGKEVVEVRDMAGLTIRDVQQKFVTTVAEDVILSPAPGSGRRGIPGGKIYGFPMYVDTMVLFANRALTDAAGITEPPRTWNEFQDAVRRTTKFDEENKIVQAGGALGTARNVPRAPDLLAAIMMQRGTVMSNEFGQATFGEKPAGLAEHPTFDALRFYTDFANPGRDVYTWNADEPDALDAFIQGRLAYFFGYSYHIPVIRARAPKLNFTTAPLPQLTPDIPINVLNIANYWALTVSQKSDAVDEAWDFILFATGEEGATAFLKKTGRPTALRAKALIEAQKKDLFLAPFAEQLLTARTWYRGTDGVRADTIIEEMIEQALAAVLAGNAEQFEQTVERAQTKVNQTVK